MNNALLRRTLAAALVFGGAGTVFVTACGSAVESNPNAGPTSGTGAAGTSGTSTASGTSASNALASVAAGTGGASTTGTTTGTGGASTTSASSTTTNVASSSSTGGGCGACGMGLECCNGECVNEKNDIKNCGGCGTTCAGLSPFCDAGQCGKPPCNGKVCAGVQTCCGDNCCNAGELCCELSGPVDMLACTMPVNGTCPKGCPGCVCASPDTPIATPLGERSIEDLRVGDLVYSVRGDAYVVVPIARVNRVPVHDHSVVRLTLDSGRVLEISARHPTADGRKFGDLRAGSRLDGARVVSAEMIPYVHDFTYDILPATESGTYVAGGVVIGSTLKDAN